VVVVAEHHARDERVAGDKRSMLTQAGSAPFCAGTPDESRDRVMTGLNPAWPDGTRIGRSLVGLPQEIFAPTLSAIGWEAAVGLGTLGLACVTAYLAYATRRMARVAEQDLASEFIPVLVDDLDTCVDRNTITLAFKNVGRGPAMYAEVESGGLRIDDHPREFTSSTVSIGPAAKATLAIAVQGAEIPCKEVEVRVEVDLIYRGMIQSDQPYRSSFVITVVCGKVDKVTSVYYGLPGQLPNAPSRSA
jgi:hypothetical protein